MTGLDVDDSLRLSIKVVGLGFLSGVFFMAPVVVLWLRWLERRDSSQDAPPVDERLLGEMARREDWIPQNHMGSVVLVKPGILRTALFRAGHRGLGLLLRVLATDGYLGSMRTVHFAHWAFVNNGSRLMFFSNFDHSWESYLDDFIEKAHVRSHPGLGQRCRFSADPLPRARWREPRPQVQGVGPPFDGGEPLLVQRLP